MSVTNGRVAAEVHRKALENVVNEMAITLIRTSGSPIVTDSMDFSTCLLDADGEQLALSAYILVHAASSWIGTAKIIADLREAGEGPRPGDGWIISDPYEGGAMHQGDVGIVMPMFYEEELVGWGFANLHLLDIGGAGVSGMNPAARTVYDEGLLFEPLRIIRDGRIDPTWERFIASNVRVPAPVLNDIRSMIAANNVAQRKLAEIIDRVTLPVHREYCEINKDLTERLLRRRIGGLADGRYEAVEFVEYDGRGSDDIFEARGVLEVAGDTLTFSFSGDPQLDAYVNSTVASNYGNVMANVLTTLAYGDLPYNHGMWRPLIIDSGPPGSVVNAVRPAPVSLAHADTGQKVGKLAKNLLVQALSYGDDPTLLSRVASIASDGSASAGLFGNDAAGRPTVLFYVDAGTGIGGPAQSFMDGQDAYGCTMMSGCGMPDVEVHESTDPVVFLWRNLTTNSGGPGQFRGGQGLDQAYALEYTDRMAGFFQVLAAELPSQGIGGGLPSSSCTQFPIRRAGVGEAMARGEHPTRESLGGEREIARNREGAAVLNRADVLHAINGGGSGLGDPLLRDVERVAKDVRDGFVSAGHARAAYAVVLDPDGNLDAGATAAERERMRAGRIGGVPELEQRRPANVGVSVVRGGSAAGDLRWCCGYCGTALCGLEQDWRTTGSVVRSERLTEVYERYEMQVVARTQAPDVFMHEYFCPACAGSLVVDVLPEGVSVRSPRLT